MAEREGPGDFDYQFGDIVDVADGDGSEADDARVDAEQDPGGDMSFDAFDENTWYFEPAPAPWYRRGRTVGVLAVTGIAAVAFVVSGVLLAFRTPGAPAGENTAPVEPTAQTAAPVHSESRSSAPQPPPPPSPSAPPSPAPAETSAAPAAAPPPATYRPRTPAARTGRDPQIGVTRTPVTRSPISVAPQRPGQSR
ncbi:hypothetical protein DQP55_02045 [Mycolicibacterium sp. GF69]|uniref:hypothetical protein n=1 Tax=Mycolicibacterium sp. GF69 TaxID=2267251 RepID=UPI000DCC3698|nr:hypothetical protein [Mycolicibacterium sp. GF69]RAV18269.1 hypothetical protein DQP55_02045 [Mycolicibacterium sp. GF69]